MIHLDEKFEETPTTLIPAERMLLRAADEGALLWCGRGATALYWAFRAAGSDGEVILPALTCPSVVQSALLAGMEPRFADTDPRSGLLTAAEAMKRLTSKTRAIVFTHLYGQTGDLSDLVRLCTARGVALIEDAAHALGGVLPGHQPIGSVGDMTIFSFSRTKIVESGGGALLLRTKEWVDRLNNALTESRPDFCISAEELLLSETAFHHAEHAATSMLRLGAQTEEVVKFSRLVADNTKRICLAGSVNPEKLAADLAGLADVAKRRVSKAEIYARVFEGSGLEAVSRWRESGVSWRFTVLVPFPERLTEFTRDIRLRGALVSNLYWPLCDFYRPGDDCPAAREFARRIVNFCVDDSVSDDWVRKAAENVREVALRYQDRTRLTGRAS